MTTVMAPLMKRLFVHAHPETRVPAFPIPQKAAHQTEMSLLHLPAKAHVKPENKCVVPILRGEHVMALLPSLPKNAMESTTIATVKSTKTFLAKATLAGFSEKKAHVLAGNASASTAISNVSRHFNLFPRINATIPSMTIAMVSSTNPLANARQARNSTVTTAFPKPKEKASAKAANSSVSPMARWASALAKSIPRLKCATEKTITAMAMSMKRSLAKATLAPTQLARGSAKLVSMDAPTENPYARLLSYQKPKPATKKTMIAMVRSTTSPMERNVRAPMVLRKIATLDHLVQKGRAFAKAANKPAKTASGAPV